MIRHNSIFTLATWLLLPSFAQLHAAHAQTFVEPGVRVLHTFSGATSGETFGWAIADLADVDRDGAKDLIVGAPTAGDQAPAAGRAYVYSGRSGRLLYRFEGQPGEQLGFSEADAGDVDEDGVTDFLLGGPLAGPGHVYLHSGRTGALLDQLDGEAAGDAFGFSVGGLGDVDGDRVADFAVGAARYSGIASRAGRAYIFSGKTRQLLRTLDGQAAGDLFGTGIAGVGDLNADRRGELIVGARNAGGASEGRAYVYSGRDGSARFAPFAPVASGVDFGWFFVASPGDVNADGTRDLYVGDVSDAGGNGRGYVYSGQTGQLLYNFPGAPGDGLGCGRGAGDVDGDQHADLILGGYTSSAGTSQAGQVTLYRGCDGASTRTITSTSAGENLGFDAVGMGDLDLDREVDFAVSAASADRVYLIAGAATCISDFDRNGSVDTRDRVAFYRAFAHREARADTNCDGRHDARDVTNYLRTLWLGCR